MMPITFKVPAEFANPLVFERFGALIKDRATGQIVGHLQEAGGWGLLRHLPMPGGNPLQMVTDVVQVGQLVKIQQTLDTVQTLATVGAVASVASLGVSIAGFALVLSKLKRMDAKLDRLLSESAKVRQLAERVSVKLDAMPLARLRSELEAVGMAWHYEPTRRRESLQRSIAELATLRHYYAALLADEQFCSLGTDNLLALLDTHERLIAASEAELFAEFLLGSDVHLIKERWRRQKEVLENIGWRTPAELFELARQGDRDLGVDLVISAADRSVKVKALTQVRTESLERLSSLPALASTLQDRGIPAVEYLRAIEDRGAGPEPMLVFEARVAA